MPARSDRNKPARPEAPAARRPQSWTTSFGEFEHRSERLLPRRKFALRLLRSFSWSMVLAGPALGIGICGYHFLEGLPWIDALLNASMILGGMGPIDPLHTTAGKLFASWYALFSGLVLIGAAGILLAPALHRLMHRFHMEKPGER